MRIICDLDGVLCNNKHRLHHIEGEKKEWHAFLSEIPKDTPVPGVYNLILDLQDHHTLLFITGRSEDYRELTKTWLWNNGFNTKWNSLCMRKEGDFRPDFVVKEEILLKFHAVDIKPTLAFEDSKPVIEMYKKYGITVLVPEWF